MLLLLIGFGTPSPVAPDPRGTAGGADTPLSGDGGTDARRDTAGASDGRLSGGGSGDQ